MGWHFTWKRASKKIRGAPSVPASRALTSSSLARHLLGVDNLIRRFSASGPIAARLSAVANPTSARTRGFVPAGRKSFLLQPAFARHPLAVHDAPPEFVILRIPPAHIVILTGALQHAGDGIDSRTSRPEEFNHVAFLERQQLQVQCAVRVTGVGRSATQGATCPARPACRRELRSRSSAEGQARGPHPCRSGSVLCLWSVATRSELSACPFGVCRRFP
jgi:hypothetical protein